MAEAPGVGRGHAALEIGNEKGSRTADFLFDTFYGGAIGGSVLALFFLVVDALQGRALFTPSLLGAMVFTGAPADPTLEVRLDMVALFSVAHLLGFLVVGAGLAAARRGFGPGTRRPSILVGLTFAVLTGGFALVALTLAPGAPATVGLPWIVAGNLLTAMAMVAFMSWSHRPDGGARDS